LATVAAEVFPVCKLLLLLPAVPNPAMNSSVPGPNEIQWCFSQVKGTLDDDVTEGEHQTAFSLFILRLYLFQKLTFYMRCRFPE
jgi:hypothetical protein